MVTSAALLVSSLIAACGPHSTDTLTIYQDAPTPKPLDLGQPGEVFGSRTLVKVAAQANPN